MDILSTVMLIFTLVVSLGILGFAFIGFFKGWKHSLLGLCRTLTAAILAFFAVFIFCKVYPAASLFGIVEGITGPIDIVSESVSTQELMGILVYTFVMPFVFSILFTIFDLLLLIPAHFIGKALGIKGKKKNIEKAEEANAKADDAKKADDDKKADDANKSEPESAPDAKPKKHPLDRIGGIGIKLVTALIVVMISLMPVTGIFYTLTDGIVDIADTAAEIDASVNIGASQMVALGHTLTDSEGNLDADETDLLVHETLDPVRNNIYMKLSYSAPMRLVYNGMVGSKNGDGKLRNEVAQVFDLVSNALYLTVDLEDYGQPQKDAVTNIFAYVSGSELHCNIATDILKGVSTRVLEDKTVFGKDLSALKKEPGSIVSVPLLEILSKTDPATVRQDLNTIRDTLIIVIDYGIPGEIALALAEQNSEGIYGVIANEDLIYDILVTVYHTEDFRHLTGPTIDLMFTVFTRRFDADAEVVRVAGDHVEGLTDAELREEAKIFADLIRSIDTVMSSLPAFGESSNAMAAIVSLDMAGLGDFVDHARASKFIGDGTTELLVDILESNKMDSMRDVADIMVDHIKNDEELNIKNLFTAVQQFVGILDKYENADGHDTTELAKALGDLNKTFEGDPHTAAVMKEIINESNIINSSSLSAGGEQNDSSQKMMNVFIDQLSSKEFTEEELEKEAKALDYSMQLIQASGQENSAEQLKEVYTGEKMNEMIDVMTDSQITSAAINEIAYDEEGNLTEDALEISSSVTEEDKEDFKEKCEEVYNTKLDEFSADKTEEEIAEYKETLKTNMSSLASIFGESLDFDSWDENRNQNNNEEENNG